MEILNRHRESENDSDMTLFRKKRRRRGPAERMWKPIRLHLTEKYKYISNNIFLRLLYVVLDLFIMPFIYLFLRSTWNFQVEGKENLKSVRKRSAITVANHVHDVDALMITKPLWPRTPYIVARKHNLEVVFIGWFNRIMRAVPLPEDLRNFNHFTQAINKLLRTTKHKVHIFPEGEISPYAPTLRTFERGAFHFSIDNNVPVVPMTFVFPTKHTVRLIVGRPIDPQEMPQLQGLSNPRKVKELCAYTKQVMQNMIDTYYEGRAYDPRHTT